MFDTIPSATGDDAAAQAIVTALTRPQSGTALLTVAGEIDTVEIGGFEPRALEVDGRQIKVTQGAAGEIYRDARLREKQRLRHLTGGDIAGSGRRGVCRGGREQECDPAER